MCRGFAPRARHDERHQPEREALAACGDVDASVENYVPTP
jgi:hypothetical protein